MTGWRVDQAELRDMVKACAADREMPARVLAVALDVKTEVVHALLAGNRQWWLEAVETLADLFEMSVDELVGEGVPPKRRADIKRGRQARQVPATEVVTGKLRALCCSCGTMTRISRTAFIRDQDDPDRRSPRDSSWGMPLHTADRLSGNSMALAECLTCKRDRGVAETPHAVIQDHTKVETREQVERWQRLPSADSKARIERDELVRRIEGFGVDVHWRIIRSKRSTKKGSLHPAIGVEFDESKSRWRIEINTAYPPSMQLAPLKEAWEVVALDKSDWWAEFDGSPTQGAWLYPGADDLEAALSGLVTEIHNAAPAVLTSIVLDIDDREINS